MKEKDFERIINILKKVQLIEITTSDIQMKIDNDFQFNKKDIIDDLKIITKLVEEIQDSERLFYYSYLNNLKQ